MGLRKTLAAALLVATATAQADIAERPEVQAFIGEMAAEHGFARAELERLFARVAIRDDIIAAISRPAEAKPWHQYRPIFVTEARAGEGVAFWQQHAARLADIEQKYGVPAHVIVAILGVETRYGRHRGSHRVMDALSTLAFEYPPRAKFFRGQLEHFLLMARDEGIDPMELTGSYAGAMGQPQFIPSSFRAYAVDHDDDGRRDLWDNMDDIAASVANYFERHKWRPGEPVAVRAELLKPRPGLNAKNYKPDTTVGDLVAGGVTLSEPLDPDLPAALIALEGKDGPEHWVVLHNFYVITRYNHSPLYAMAVHQLSEAVREGYRRAAR